MQMAKKPATILAAAVLLAALAAPAAAQSDVEVGVLGLISDYRSVTVSNVDRDGSVGPELGFSAGFILGQSMGERWGGEFRYIYFRNDLGLDAGSDKAELGAQSHAVHYDVLYYFSDKDVKVRPYVAAGIGVKNYQGTGAEDPFQPGSDLALLTAVGETKLMGDFGVGVKFRIGQHAVFRAEFRDYITGIPQKLITPAPGASIDGDVLHHWAPLIGISWIW